MTPPTGDRGRAGEARPASLRPAANPTVPVPGPPALAAGLAALLASEDTLFRDPFADFAPSGR